MDKIFHLKKSEGKNTVERGTNECSAINVEKFMYYMTMYLKNYGKSRYGISPVLQLRSAIYLGSAQSNHLFVPNILSSPCISMMLALHVEC